MSDVYVVTHTSSSGFGLSRMTQSEIVDVYATEAIAKAALAAQRERLIGTGHLRVTEHKDGLGFSYGSVHGSMSFAPGAYTCKRFAVVSG